MHEAEIWRALSRFPELQQSIVGVATLVDALIPVSGILVGRIDVQGRGIRPVAEDWRGSAIATVFSKQSWKDDEVEHVLAWHRGGVVCQAGKESRHLMRLFCSAAIRMPVTLLPLRDAEQGPGGLLVLVGRDAAFSSMQEAQLGQLVEPFSMALANDTRLHQLSQLRETLEADNRALRSRLERQDIVETIVGTDAGLAEVMARVEQVAPTDAPVLILGETGTGKEVVARAIHQRSRCAKGPMVRVNCGAIPPGLVDSELFGHERGSFTGAVATRTGWFERADSGTLFLDEIAELPLEAQVRLLRVLQEGVLERVGASRPIHVNVRIVAATHRDLEDMVAAGSFRDDLWYRLAVFPIALPPLAERRHDIPALAEHFSARAGKRLGGGPLVPTRTDLNLLLAYEWPGNVRELAAVIERAAILGNGKWLDIAGALGTQRPGRPDRPQRRASDGATEGKRLPAAEGGPGPLNVDVSGVDVSGADVTSQRVLSLDEVQKRHIERALAVTRGRVEGEGGAAALLEINPHTLRGRMRRLGIDWVPFRKGQLP